MGTNKSFSLILLNTIGCAFIFSWNLVSFNIWKSQFENYEALQRVQLILHGSVEERHFAKLSPREPPGVDEVNHFFQGFVIKVLDDCFSDLGFSQVGLKHGQEETGPHSEDQFVDSKALGVGLQSKVSGSLIIQ